LIDEETAELLSGGYRTLFFAPAEVVGIGRDRRRGSSALTDTPAKDMQT
jgi:hypothetical protein